SLMNLNHVKKVTDSKNAALAAAAAAVVATRKVAATVVAAAEEAAAVATVAAAVETVVATAAAAGEIINPQLTNHSKSFRQRKDFFMGVIILIIKITYLIKTAFFAIFRSDFCYNPNYEENSFCLYYLPFLFERICRPYFWRRNVL
ncbi:MAG: hypothetical protein WCJ85_09310, partial [Chitinophagaceae bacterium]